MNAVNYQQQVLDLLQSNSINPVELTASKKSLLVVLSSQKEAVRAVELVNEAKLYRTIIIPPSVVGSGMWRAKGISTQQKLIGTNKKASITY
jgi:hypothetical protein